jgi:hypothetical protein
MLMIKITIRILLGIGFYEISRSFGGENGYCAFPFSFTMTGGGSSWGARCPNLDSYTTCKRRCPAPCFNKYLVLALDVIVHLMYIGKAILNQSESVEVLKASVWETTWHS